MYFIFTFTKKVGEAQTHWETPLDLLVQHELIKIYREENPGSFLMCLDRFVQNNTQASLSSSEAKRKHNSLEAQITRHVYQPDSQRLKVAHNSLVRIRHACFRCSIAAISIIFRKIF